MAGKFTIDAAKFKEEQLKNKNQSSYINELHSYGGGIRILPLELIDDFPGHPFKVLDNEDMDALVDSVRENGVITPILVRRKDDGRYESISGHRRRHACRILGKTEIPAQIVDLDDDAAAIQMVDANLQREKILPSEKAFAYKIRLEAMKRKAGRPKKENSTPMVSDFDKLRSNEVLANEIGESREQIRRYIRLTELIPDLLQMVDDGKVPFRCGVDLSYLSKEEQETVRDCFIGGDRMSLQKAEELKQRSKDGSLDIDKIIEIMAGKKAKGAKTEEVLASLERACSLPAAEKDDLQFTVSEIAPRKKYLHVQLRIDSDQLMAGDTVIRQGDSLELLIVNSVGETRWIRTSVECDSKGWYVPGHPELSLIGLWCRLP